VILHIKQQDLYKEFMTRSFCKKYHRRNCMKPKKGVFTPEKLACILISDLSDTRTTYNGDRCSDYFVMAKGIGEKECSNVSVLLIEGKANLPKDEWYYAIHVINDIDDSNCYVECTKTLDKQELAALLAKNMRDLNCIMKEGIQ